MKSSLEIARLRISKEITKKRKDTLFGTGEILKTARTYKNGKIAGLRSAMKIIDEVLIK